MTLQFALSSPGCAPAWMTFPQYRPLLTVANPETVAVTGRENGDVIALALARHSTRTNLLSLYVAPSHRRRGVGLALLDMLETVLAQKGCCAVSATWMDSMPGSESFSALLRKRGWHPPQPRMVLFRAELARLREADWINSFADLPEGYAIVPWHDLTHGQLAMLRQAIRFEGWVPPELMPFNFEGVDRWDGALPEPGLNLACLAWGEVVGWSFMHRIDPQTVRSSCSFVKPDLQGQLLILALWRETIIRLAATPYRKFSWGVSVTRDAMLRFNDRYMSPYVSQRIQSWESHKSLDQSTTGK